MSSIAVQAIATQAAERGQTQGEILLSFLRNRCRPMERWHQTLKNRILLENDFLPKDFEAQIKSFDNPYNHQNDH